MATTAASDRMAHQLCHGVAECCGKATQWCSKACIPEGLIEGSRLCKGIGTIPQDHGVVTRMH